jgi:hypothetical protein
VRCSRDLALAEIPFLVAIAAGTGLQLHVDQHREALGRRTTGTVRWFDHSPKGPAAEKLTRTQKQGQDSWKSFSVKMIAWTGP